MIATALARTRLAIVVPHDMVLDHELWRWTPDDVSLHVTRTRHTASEVTMQMVSAISDARLVAAAVSTAEQHHCGQQHRQDMLVHRQNLPQP